ncbi:MAG: hypothetical protein CMH54_03855 [Myxococcales bacterium]|nr:hypothetical protein [Myxococcales bacterium]
MNKPLTSSILMGVGALCLIIGSLSSMWMSKIENRMLVRAGLLEAQSCVWEVTLSDRGDTLQSDICSSLSYQSDTVPMQFHIGATVLFFFGTSAAALLFIGCISTLFRKRWEFMDRVTWLILGQCMVGIIIFLTAPRPEELSSLTLGRGMALYLIGGFAGLIGTLLPWYRDQES